MYIVIVYCIQQCSVSKKCLYNVHYKLNVLISKIISTSEYKFTLSHIHDMEKNVQKSQKLKYTIYNQ